MTIVRRKNTRSTPTSSWDLADFGSFGGFFSDFDQLFDELSPRLRRTGGFQGYPVDLYETGDALILEMAVPGVNADELDISIEGRQLTIQGMLAHSQEDENRRYWVQSIPRGEFRRSVTLPTTVEVDKVEATVRGGLLHLRMPKVGEARARKIEVQAG